MNKFLVIFGVVALVVLLVPTVLPSKFSMSRSIEINAPLNLVFAKLTDLNEYVKWNPFPEGDPTNTAEVSGLGLGSSLVWKGDMTGAGKMTILNLEPEHKIIVKMDFYKPMRGEGLVRWITSPKADNKTELVWTFDQELSYFMRYFGLLMESMMSKHFEKGLTNYKTLVENSK